MNEIAKNLREGVYNANPVGASHALAQLSGEYAFICGQLEEILSSKPAVWNELRKDVKSDTACERVWENTKKGIDETGLRLRLKAMDKMSSALKSLINLATGELRNLSN